jgi:mutator protein MutT
MSRADVTRIAIAVVEHAGCFLIGPRPAGVPLEGLWEFPGGKVGQGETPAEAAARECLEETGLQVEVGLPYPEHLHEYEHGRVHLHFFACRPLSPQDAPRPPFRWVPRRQLGEFSFPAGNRALLESLARRAD